VKILSEHHASECGEYDFFIPESCVERISILLINAGYMVGGGNDPTRVTINLDSLGGHHTDIEKARELIVAAP
jgi:hypothetical protein